MSELNQVHSVLEMKSIYFDEISFVRKNIENIDSGDKGQINFEVSGPIIYGEQFKMGVKAYVCAGDTYEMRVSVCGVFSVEGGLSDNNLFLTTNAVAIMFPYLRSELTLLTAQPGLSPLVLPPVNINALMKDSQRE